MTAPLESMVVTSPYGYRIHPVTGEKSFHNGVDLRAPIGTEVRAPFGGVVNVYSSGAGGLQMTVTHPGGLRAGFAHLLRVAPGVVKGSIVEEGQVIGQTGNSGSSTGPHLHFTLGLRSQSGLKRVDPLVVAW